MLINQVRKQVRDDLESPPELRRVGTGWLAGVAGLLGGLASLFLVLSLRFPSLSVTNAYGIEGHPVPQSYFRQLWYPFAREKP